MVTLFPSEWPVPQGPMCVGQVSSVPTWKLDGIGKGRDQTPYCRIVYNVHYKLHKTEKIQFYISFINFS